MGGPASRGTPEPPLVRPGHPPHRPALSDLALPKSPALSNLALPKSPALSDLAIPKSPALAKRAPQKALPHHALTTPKIHQMNNVYRPNRRSATSATIAPNSSRDRSAAPASADCASRCST